MECGAGGADREMIRGRRVVLWRTDPAADRFARRGIGSQDEVAQVGKGDEKIGDRGMARMQSWAQPIA